MPRPPLEVADVVRAAGTTFYERSRKWFTWLHLKILTAIVCCRTSALGGHIDECSRCGHGAISFNSCRNRHCPKCQSNARDRWLEARRRELLPVRYAHVVFTLPAQLAPLALQNKSEIYGLLFRASAETLLTVARYERHLGAEIGFFSVLHTWNQKLQHHPHVHCIVPAGRLSPDHTQWIAARSGFFLPVRVLSRVFRGKFVAGLRELHATGRVVAPRRSSFPALRLLDLERIKPRTELGNRSVRHGLPKGWSTMALDGTKTILLAEDEESYRSPLLALLKKSDYNVIVGIDGLDALEKARDHKGEIHLLLSNVQMPRMTGIELATQLCAERPEMGVLLISGGAAGMLVLNHGWQFLPKPLMFQVLRERIDSMLNQRPTSNRNPSDFGSPAE